MIDQTHVQVFRRPGEFLPWFDSVLRTVNGNRSDRQAALLHRGFYKRFSEEIMPLASLLRLKRLDWTDSRFRNVFGSQPFDVEVQNHRLEHIEIASATFDEGERFRMLRFLSEGHVDALAKIVLDVDGRPVALEDSGAMRLHDDLIDERLAVIQAQVIKKSAKRYPEKTGLLVFFDDASIRISDEDSERFRGLLESLRPTWTATFSSVFLVGPQASICIDVERA